VATLSLFGYDPLLVYTGRAPLEAAAMGLSLGVNDWAIRCNLVTIADGRMRDFTAGHIASSDARGLITALNHSLGGPLPGMNASLEFHAGVSYRNILLFQSESAGPFSSDTWTQPPHDIPDLAVEDNLPRGPGNEWLRDWMERSRTIIIHHPVNRARLSRGEKAATQVWLWGLGQTPRLMRFAEIYGKSGVIISAVDLVRGVGTLLGWDRIDVPGATGYLDTDYSAKGRAGVKALADHDLVCVHIEAPDEASHEGRADAKVTALERIDQQIVGPILDAMPSHGEWRILVSPDHRTLLRTRAHTHGPVPFVVAGTGIAARGQASFDEAIAEGSELRFAEGHKLMPWFLGMGLSGK
jgi:2,3-bisphosphoglycerate-independent phosphoglycerate mutase